jgi:hypothetical protein
MRASNAAGLSPGGRLARDRVHGRGAGEQRLDVDALQRGGQSPTAQSSLVRPPTQSHIGKRASQPSLMATWSSFASSPVTATRASR